MKTALFFASLCVFALTTVTANVYAEPSSSKLTEKEFADLVKKISGESKKAQNQPPVESPTPHPMKGLGDAEQPPIQPMLGQPPQQPAMPVMPEPMPKVSQVTTEAPGAIRVANSESVPLLSERAGDRELLAGLSEKETGQYAVTKLKLDSLLASPLWGDDRRVTFRKLKDFQAGLADADISDGSRRVIARLASEMVNANGAINLQRAKETRQALDTAIRGAMRDKRAEKEKAAKEKETEALSAKTKSRNEKVRKLMNKMALLPPQLQNELKMNIDHIAELLDEGKYEKADDSIETLDGFINQSYLNCIAPPQQGGIGANGPRGVGANPLRGNLIGGGQKIQEPAPRRTLGDTHQ